MQPTPQLRTEAPASAPLSHNSSNTSNNTCKTVTAPAIGVAGLLGRPYKTIRLEWSSGLSLLRVRMNVRPIQCYSLAAMGELHQMLSDIGANPGLVRHFVLSSDVPRVFNFGGDLSLFVLLARAGDVESLKLYGKRCVDLVWWMENAANLGVHTTVLSQGDTLGGGLESVLPFHKVIFERSAQGGFPEVLFNLFPGMGAWDFTIRKAGFAVANEMVLSGRLYSAEELHSRKLVDLVVDDGQGEAAVHRVVSDVDPRLRGTLAALRAQRLAAPVRYDTLMAIVDQWAESALGLTDRDLRLMERLARAQARKAGGADEGAVEEIKHMELENAWGERRGRADRRSEAAPDRRTQS
jgi:DSF synthase